MALNPRYTTRTGKEADVSSTGKGHESSPERELPQFSQFINLKVLDTVRNYKAGMYVRVSDMDTVSQELLKPQGIEFDLKSVSHRVLGEALSQSVEARVGAYVVAVDDWVAEKVEARGFSAATKFNGGQMGYSFEESDVWSVARQRMHLKTYLQGAITDLSPSVIDGAVEFLATRLEVAYIRANGINTLERVLSARSLPNLKSILDQGEDLYFMAGFEDLFKGAPGDNVSEVASKARNFMRSEHPSVISKLDLATFDVNKYGQYVSQLQGSANSLEVSGLYGQNLITDFEDVRAIVDVMRALSLGDGSSEEPERLTRAALNFQETGEKIARRIVTEDLRSKGKAVYKDANYTQVTIVEYLGVDRDKSGSRKELVRIAELAEPVAYESLDFPDHFIHQEDFMGPVIANVNSGYLVGADAPALSGRKPAIFGGLDAEVDEYETQDPGELEEAEATGDMVGRHRGIFKNTYTAPAYVTARRPRVEEPIKNQNVAEVKPNDRGGLMKRIKRKYVASVAGIGLALAAGGFLASHYQGEQHSTSQDKATVTAVKTPEQKQTIQKGPAVIATAAVKGSLPVPEQNPVLPPAEAGNKAEQGNKQAEAEVEKTKMNNAVRTREIMAQLNPVDYQGFYKAVLNDNAWFEGRNPDIVQPGEEFTVSRNGHDWMVEHGISEAYAQEMGSVVIEPSNGLSQQLKAELESFVERDLKQKVEAQTFSEVPAEARDLASVSHSGESALDEAATLKNTKLAEKLGSVVTVVERSIDEKENHKVVVRNAKGVHITLQHLPGTFLELMHEGEDLRVQPSRFPGSNVILIDSKDGSGMPITVDIEKEDRDPEKVETRDFSRELTFGDDEADSEDNLRKAAFMAAASEASKKDEDDDDDELSLLKKVFTGNLTKPVDKFSASSLLKIRVEKKEAYLTGKNS